LGNGSDDDQWVPVQVLGVNGSGYLKGISQIGRGYETGCGVSEEGIVYCWGDNFAGQCGDNTSTDRFTPVQVLGVSGSGYLTNIFQIDGGFDHTCALQTDGTVYCWGYNRYGRLGDNTTTNRPTPVQVLGVNGSGFLTDIWSSCQPL